MNLSGKKALVAGTGISGIAAAKLLMDDDVAVILYDENEQLSTEDVRGRFGNLAPEEMIFGPFPNARAEEIGLAVLSPEFPQISRLCRGCGPRAYRFGEKLSWPLTMPGDKWLPLPVQMEKQPRQRLLGKLCGIILIRCL